MDTTKSITQNLIVFVSLLTFVLLYICQTHYFWHYTNDDAYITFRYSRNIANGLGPYFNAGEHVEGYTSFLWMVFVTFVIYCSGPAVAPFAAKLAGPIFGAATIALTFLLFRTVFLFQKSRLSPCISDIGALMAAGIVAVNPAFAVNSTSGLETTMFSFLLLLGMYLAAIEEIKQAWRGSALALGAAILTRPEAILLVGIYWFTSMLISVFQELKRGGAKNSIHELYRAAGVSQSFRLHLCNGVILAIIFLSHELFRYCLYDGEWVPNTYYAKQGGFWRAGPWTYIFEGLVAPVFGIIGLVFSIIGWLLARHRMSPKIIPLALMTICSASVPLMVGTDWMVGWRLVIPYLPLVSILITVGWVCFTVEAGGVRTWLAMLLALIGLTALWIKYDHTREEVLEYIETRSYGYQTGHMALASWLHTEAEKGCTIALMDVGIIGYVCIDQSVLDLSGLTDRFIAKSSGTFLNKVYPPKYILDRKPEFVVLDITAPGISYTPPARGTIFRVLDANGIPARSRSSISEIVYEKASRNN